MDDRKKFASVGDTIECDLHNWPFKIRMTLDTRESAAYASELLMDGTGWRLVPHSVRAAASTGSGTGEAA